LSEQLPIHSVKKINELTVELARATARLKWGDLEKSQLESERQKLHSIAKALLEQLPSAAVLFDASGKMLGYNQKFEKFWHLPDHFSGGNHDDVIIRHISQKLCDEKRLFFSERYSTLTTIEDELNLIDGSRITLKRHTILHQGETAAQLWIFENPNTATEVEIKHRQQLALIESRKKQLQKELKGIQARLKVFKKWVELAQFSEEGLAITDRSNKWMFVNPAFLKLCLNNHQAQWKGKTWQDSLPAKLVDFLQKNVWPGLKSVKQWQGTVGDVEIGERVCDLQIHLRVLEDNAIAWLVSDITISRQLESALALNAQRLEQLYNEMPSIHFMLDVNCRILSVNTFGAEQLGYRVEMLLEQNFNKIIDTTDHTIFKDFIAQQAANPGILQKIDLPIKTAYHKQRWMEISGRATYGKNGELHFLLVCQDISARKNAEKQLKENENRLNSLMDSIPTGVCVINLSSGIVYSNQSLAEMLGYLPEEMKQLKASELFNMTDRVQYTELLFNLQSNASDELNRMQLVDHHNRSIPVKVFTRSVYYNNEPGVLAVFWDLRKEKETEEKLRQSIEKYEKLVNTAPEGIVTVDLSGNITFVNAHTSIMLDYENELLIGSNILDFVKPEDRQRLEKVVSGQVSTDVLRDVRFICQNGDILYVDVFSAVNEDEYGDPIATQLILVDVTERWHKEHQLEKHTDDLAERLKRRNSMYLKRLEEIRAEVKRRKKTEAELQKYQTELRMLSAHLEEAREKERKWIAQELHDEFGQQLGALKMNLTQLEKLLPHTNDEVLEKTRKMSEIIDTTIQKVREVSRKLRPSMLDNLGFAAAVAWQAKEFHKNSGIQVNVRIDDNIDLPDKIGSALFRVFQETLTNVYRHARATEVDVDIFMDGDDLFMSIRDNGVGFDSEKLKNPKTFGLIGIRERVHSLGGEVTFDSQVGEGTTVNVVVPMQQEDKGND
jgi:PAS domain S-box-containing protein